MSSVFYLHKRSGKLKRIFKNTATALNIDGYVFPKVTGRRFVTHRLKGAKVLLHNWRALADLYLTAVADAKTKPTVRAKIQNPLKKLNDFQFRCHIVMYYKILSVCLALLFEFEKKFILASDVCNLLQNTIEDLEEHNDEDQNLVNLGICIVRSEVIFIWTNYEDVF